jgi:hypothetical protein
VITTVVVVITIFELVVKIGKRNGLTPEKRTKINVLFSNGGTFCLQKTHKNSHVMQMQRFPNF